MPELIVRIPIVVPECPACEGVTKMEPYGMQYKCPSCGCIDDIG